MADSITLANAIEVRRQFFEFLFGNEIGHLCVAIGNTDKSYFKQHWFKWPEQREEMGAFFEKNRTKFNIWFGVTLFNRPERKRAYAVPGCRVWADLDNVNPTQLELSPNAIIESSPGRFQAFWVMANPVPPDIAQDFSRRLAYDVGADKSGWDLEQLLRVPFTMNFKYEEPREVKLTRIVFSPHHIDSFDALPLPQVESINGDDEIIDVGMPDPQTLPDLQSILYFYRIPIKQNSVFMDLFSTEPEETDDWSKRLWRLTNICFEMGMTEEEAFVISAESQCNKYKRDNRPISYLWREVLKAGKKFKSFNALMGINTAVRLEMPKLIDEDEITEDSFVAEYKTWANIATDAPEQYHELACFVALSSVLSNGLALQTTFTDNFRPNLWALILGESTLTRKSTAMRMAMDLITDLDRELIIASDGSAEGLMTALAGRPEKVSIFYRDEVSGFFDSINRKDYLAGFQETLTQLYDVPKILPRLLRKETITVVEPYFIFFGGGIRDKVYSLINDDYILSGFLPRFLIVSSENDMARVRRTGPPTNITTTHKDNIVTRLADLKERYDVQVPIKIGTQSAFVQSKIECRLDDKAWEYFGDLEMKLINAAVDSPWQMLALPTFQRMAFSMLKMTMLIAASRRPPNANNTLTVEISDIKQAAYYIQKWGQHSLDLIMSSGKSTTEKILDKALSFVRNSHEGVTQSQMMQRFHLTSREMKEIRDTLVDRGLVDLEQRGRGYKMKAIRF